MYTGIYKLADKSEKPLQPQFGHNLREDFAKATGNFEVPTYVFRYPEPLNLVSFRQRRRNQYF